MRQQYVQMRAISAFGSAWLNGRGQRWLVRKITDHVLFSEHPGPWMLLEQAHFQRWVNLNSDRHFRIRWSGWQ